jgi:hypothetical protein
VKISNLYTCCEQEGRRGKDYETKLTAAETAMVEPIPVVTGYSKN